MLMKLDQTQVEQMRSPNSSSLRFTRLQQSELRQSELKQSESKLSESKLSKNHFSPILKDQNKKYVIGCIDNSLAVLKYLRQCLEDERFSFFTIEDPVKALMVVIRKNPDLIILNAMVEGVDGYGLCALLRKHPKFRATPIIIITSDVDFTTRAKVKMINASVYSDKNLTTKKLLGVIENYLDLSD